MTIRMAAFRLLAGAFVALGVLAGGMLTGAPVSAQEAPQEPPQDIPWYMPQPWVHPPQTGPKIRKLPGYYGHTYRNRSYGSFSNYCYGDCGYRPPGTVSTGYGVILSQPVVVVFNPRDYDLVPRADYQPQQAAAAPRAAAPAQPVVVPVRDGQQAAQKPLPKFAVQHGVRIIRPAPLANY